MRYCPQCGAGNPDAAVFCGACGVPFAASPAAPAAAPKGLGKMTMVGMAPLSPIAPPQPQPVAQPQPPPSVAQPMSSAPATTADPPRRHAGMAQTMLGMPPMSVPAVPPAAASGSAATQLSFSAPQVATPPPPAAAPAPPPAAPATSSAAKGKTMILGASPMPAAKGGKINQTMMMQAPAGMSKKTLIGGIVPLPLRKAEPEYVEEEYEEIVPETGEVERRVRLVAKPLPPIHRRPAFLAIVGALVLGAVGVVAALLIRSPLPLVAEPRLDASGKDVLHVTCASCPDDTVIALAGAKGTLKATEGDVPLGAPLKVGDSELELAIDRPGTGRDETVKVKVSVAYRIWPELAALQDPIPSVRVMVEAAPGSSATVDGKPVTLGPDGRGIAKVDVTEQLSGLSRETKALEREIPYTIASPGREPAQSKLSVKVGVAPLWLDSPGARMVTDGATFMLAGRTAKSGGVTVAGRAISVNPEGMFAQLMNISAVGATEVKVRASVSNLAPRIATITVQRVASLAAEARDREAQTKTGYDDVAQKGDSAAGTPIAWRGDVIQATTQGHQIIAVVGVSTGCAKKPCRARVTIPGGGALSTGDAVGLFGRVVRFTPDDLKVPDIEADFVTKGP